MIFNYLLHKKQKTYITKILVYDIQLIRFVGHIQKVLEAVKNTANKPLTTTALESVKTSTNNTSVQNINNNNILNKPKIEVKESEDLARNVNKNVPPDDNNKQLSIIERPKNVLNTIKDTFNEKVKDTVQKSYNRPTEDSNIIPTIKTIDEKNNKALVIVDNTQALLNELNSLGLITYEDANEGKKVGGCTLTKMGQNIYLEIKKQKEPKLINFLPHEENVNYHICLLRTNPNTTVMLDGKQTHLVVYYNSIIGRYVAITYFTSQETAYKLADIQELSGNKDKKQYLQPFANPLIIDNFDLENMDKLTGKVNYQKSLDEYIQAIDKKKILDEIKDNAEKYKPRVYVQNGITKEDLIDVKAKYLEKVKENNILNKEAQDAYTKLNDSQKFVIEKKIKNVSQQKLAEYKKKDMSIKELTAEEKIRIQNEQITEYYIKNIKQKKK